MDLSVNNKYSKTKNINFKGIKYTYDTKNNPVFRFTAPPHKNGETVQLEYIRYINGANVNTKAAKVKSFGESGNLELDKATTKFIVEKSDGLLYRYKIGDKYYCDETESIELADGSKFNIIKTSKNYGITPKTGTMRHSFVDSDVSEQFLATLRNTTTNPANVVAPKTDLDFIHNHFNKLGGSIKGLDYLATKTTELEPYRYIISTPDIGADPTSSHKYWPNNLYQCTDLQAFKDLNFHLFEQGKGYVADGAFTSQSLQSPLVQHVYKWGKDSPWFDMLKIDENVNIGILPDDASAMQHIGVKIINNPNAEGHYREGEPTYIQFYDDRLVSQEQISSDEIIKKADGMPEDHYEITSNNDSVYMFSFEIAPDDTKHIEPFKKTNHVLLDKMENRDSFLKFERFEILPRKLAANAKFWDGNTDMIKMNLSNSDNEVAMKNARKYVYGAATFWTEMVQSDLILRSAKINSKERLHQKLGENDIPIAEIAEKNGVDIGVLKSNLGSAILPTLDKAKSLDSNVNHSLSKYLNNCITNFPLQSIETSPELSAIFAQPMFNKELFSKKDFLSRVQKTVENTIEAAIPEQYANNPDYKAYVIKTYAPEIIKNLFASALNNSAITSGGTLDSNALKGVTLKSIERYPSSAPEIEREQVISKIRGEIKPPFKLKEEDGFKPALLKSTQERIKRELQNITLEDFKLAESLTIQSRAGLNWRFDAAKDIGDMDDIRAGYANFSQVWKDVEEFWTNFIRNVRKYNPSSYIINEITDMWGLRDACYDGFGKRKENPDLEERNFLNITGSTTCSNYSTYFNRLAGFIGTNAENLEHYKDSGNLDTLYNTVNNFISVNQPNNVNLSHTFVENHDKPRLLHTLPLDIELFHSTTIKGNPSYEKLTQDLTGSKDYGNISPKAIAVAQVMNEVIKNSNYSKEDKTKLEKALKELALGRKNSSDNSVNFKRSEAFAVTPYEISIRDLFKRANITDNLDERVLDFHSSMLSKAMKQQTSLWEMMNAIPGTPTLFNGAEFAQTGYESKNKNLYQTNRNAILHYLKNDPRYKDYYEKMQAISGLYKLKGLSAIRDGAKILLNVSTIGNEGLTLADFGGGIAIPDMNIPDSCSYDYGTYTWMIGEIANSPLYQEKGFEAIEELFKNDSLTGQDKFNNVYPFFNTYNDEKNLNCFIDCYKQGVLKNAIEAIIKNRKAEAELIRRQVQLLPIFSYDDKGSQVLQIITNYNVPKYQMAKDAELDNEKTTPAINLGEKCPWQNGTILQRKVYKNGITYSDEKVPNSDSVEQKYIIQDGSIYPATKTCEGYIIDKNKKITIDDTVLTFYKV